jgi:hypothetical protein
VDPLLNIFKISSYEHVSFGFFPYETLREKYEDKFKFKFNE